MKKVLAKCLVLMAVCMMNSAVFAAKASKKINYPKVSLKVIDGKVVKYKDYSNSGFFNSHRNLCGPNDQLGTDTFDYSTECCEKKDGECVSEKSCRTPKATCIDRDSDGNATGTYDSFGLKDCGACMPVEVEDPGQVLTPFGY